MHEVSLNRVITDYITGQEIMDTTYEDLRQALARMLVEDRKYPKAVIRPKYEATYEVGGVQKAARIDIAVFSEKGDPLLALFFCPGEVGTFVRESLAVARIHLPAPFPLVAVTDSMDLQLHAAGNGRLLGEGFHAVPLWEDLAALADQNTFAPLAGERLDRERRIHMAYDGLGGPCCGGECSL